MTTGGKKATPKRKKLALAKETVKDLSTSGKEVRGGFIQKTRNCGINCQISVSKC